MAEVALNATVRIAGPEGFLCAYLAPRLAPLRAKNPGLNLQLVPMPHLMSVSKREFDIAITVGQVLKGRAVTRKLTDYSLGLFASEAYLRAWLRRSSRWRTSASIRSSAMSTISSSCPT